MNEAPTDIGVCHDERLALTLGRCGQLNVAGWRCLEGCKYQNNTDIRHQAFPESIPEEQQIHSNYNDYQQTRVERDNHTFCHFRLLSIRWSINWGSLHRPASQL
jgi:hypothetical protein